PGQAAVTRRAATWSGPMKAASTVAMPTGLLSIAVETMDAPTNRRSAPTARPRTTTTTPAIRVAATRKVAHTIPQNALTQLRDPMPLRAAAILPPIVATPRRAAEVAATVEEVGLIVGAVVVEAIVEEVALPTAAEVPRTVAAEASATAVAVVLT